MRDRPPPRRSAARATVAPVAALTVLALLSGCAGPQSMLAPAGPAAASIATMWWVLLAICTAVLLVVLVLLLGAARPREPAPGDAATERRAVNRVLLAGAAIPAVILVFIFIYTMVVLDEIVPPRVEGDLTVRVTGKQYWWRVEYPLPDGDTVVTANEIHVPVGRTVTLLLESEDVIHSVWVPRLAGKTDMIPGRTTRAWLRADEAGVYRGQCAEYCGVQHARMAMLVVAEPEREFHAWLSRQRRPAPSPPPAPAASDESMMEPGPPMPDSVRRAGLARNARLRAGESAYRNHCVQCHTIRGVAEAEGPLIAPDLTHVASRRTLAAGLLDNNRGNLGGWIANPQQLKPGSLMPRLPLEPDELQALIDYLAWLQ